MTHAVQGIQSTGQSASSGLLGSLRNRGDRDAGREVTEGSGESLQEARSKQRCQIQKKLTMKVQDEERKGRLEVKGQLCSRAQE